jgi:hypothetical protein
MPANAYTPELRIVSLEKGDAWGTSKQVWVNQVEIQNDLDQGKNSQQ